MKIKKQSNEYTKTYFLTEKQIRKLNRYEVEEIYRQYIRDGREHEAIEFVTNSGFGPISNFKGRRPESAADADAFGNY